MDDSFAYNLLKNLHFAGAILPWHVGPIGSPQRVPNVASSSLPQSFMNLVPLRSQPMVEQWFLLIASQ